ncbi:hypothetical protein HWV62_16190 [Athelia sp. TMB]|nr:hypothetical protein HWV62_16190 [Athelia sp. TMB]
MRPGDNHHTIFVDTPGLNEAGSDIEVSTQISEWFVKVYKEHPLYAILYLHRISDNKVTNSFHEWNNIKIFASMCRQKSMPRVVLGTTMWSDVSRDTGERREKELETTFWADMIANGYPMARFEDSYESAWEMVEQMATQQYPTVCQFIDHVTRQGGSLIGHELSSHTSQIRAVRYVHPNDARPVVFVDTPGFDDTYRPDIEILSHIASWFVEVYKAKIPLAAIIYLHRISDNRMASSPLKNLKMFASMCGQQIMPNVVLVTTMWKSIHSEAMGVNREKELKLSFWADMIAKGCRVARFRDSYESAWEIVGTLATQEFALVSYEIVNDKKKLNETAAGVKLNAELHKLFEDQREAARQLQEQVKNADDPTVVGKLQQEKMEIEKRLLSVEEQIQQLRIPWRRKITNWLVGGRKARDPQLAYVFFHVRFV